MQIIDSKTKGKVFVMCLLFTQYNARKCVSNYKALCLTAEYAMLVFVEMGISTISFTSS